MMIGSSASRLVNIQRQTGFALPESAATPTMAVSNQLRVPAFIEVSVKGGTDGLAPSELKVQTRLVQYKQRRSRFRGTE